VGVGGARAGALVSQPITRTSLLSVINRHEIDHLITGIDGM
jgi:hypothetical protein